MIRLHRPGLRSRAVIVFVLVFLLVPLVLAACGTKSGNAGSEGSAEDATPVPQAADEGEISVRDVGAEHPMPPADADERRVRWILDGDSLELAAATDDGSIEREEIRLIGINAPETGECLSDESRDSLIDRIKGRVVQVSGDRYDEFGRRLVHLWHEGELINLSQVSAGLAVARSAFGHDHDVLLDRAEAQARDQQIGLWDPLACAAPSSEADRTAPGVTEDTTTEGLAIIEVLFDAPGPDNENPNGEWIVIGNRGTDTVDLTGHIIRDESTRHRYPFGNERLAPEEQIRILSGCPENPAPPNAATSDRYWCGGGPIWSNSGDTAFLVDGNGAIVDSHAWDSVYEDDDLG